MGLLRLILAVSVLVAHLATFPHRHTKTVLGFTFVDPIVAVECFFMLSGFYMALVLNEKYRGPGSYLLFVTQRFYRLFPTYWIILGFILLGELLIAHFLGNRPENTYTLQDWLRSYPLLAWPTWIVLVASNLAFFGLNDIYLFFVNHATGYLCLVSKPPNIPGNAFTIVPPAWSLGIEVVFYSVAPFLVRRSVAWQIGLVLALIGLRLGLEHGLHVPYRPYIFISAPLQFPFFLAGSIAYRIYRNRAAFPRLYAKSGIPWVVLLFFICLFYHRLPGAKNAWVALYPVMFIAVPALFALTKNNYWDRQIGELSYPFYLIHFFVIELVLVAMEYIAIPTPLITPLCILITLALSIAVTQLFENRIERFRAALFERSKKKAPASESPQPASS